MHILQRFRVADENYPQVWGLRWKIIILISGKQFSASKVFSGWLLSSRILLPILDHPFP